MTRRVLDVTPEVGDLVDVTYRSEQARLAADGASGFDEAPAKTRSGKVARVVRRGATQALPDRLYLLVETLEDQTLIVPIYGNGEKGGTVYSVNFDGANDIRDFEPKRRSRGWKYRHGGNKTRQVKLGKLDHVELVRAVDD